MKKPQPNLSIVIPALNEERAIGKTLKELARFLRTDKTMKTEEVEVIVVSADSTDKTHRIIKTKAKLFKNFTFIRPGPRLGKGRDVRAGMLKAKGQAVLYMDADLATPLRHVPQAYEAYKRGADVVIATRNLRKHHPGFARRLLANTGNVLFRIMGGVWVEDSQCGFKLFSDKAAQVCFSKMTILKWGFDMEILTIARVNKFKIKTFRVNDWISVPNGPFQSENALKVAVTSLGELLNIFWHRLSGHYRG